jgi:hypothetical protein
MGTDISGFIECRTWHLHGEETPWHAAVDLFCLYTTRNYDAFGCLFGVRNFADFRPLATGRGLPGDVSEGVLAELDRAYSSPDDVFGTSWISWAEVKAVDWEEMAEAPDSRLHRYEQTPDGLKMAGKSGWSPTTAQFAAAVGLPSQPGGEPPAWPEGAEWLVDDVLYRSETLSRRDAIPADSDWTPVWVVMETLAGLHGDDNVRLVVWFDN